MSSRTSYFCDVCEQPQAREKLLFVKVGEGIHAGAMISGGSYRQFAVEVCSWSCLAKWTSQPKPELDAVS